MVYQSREEAGRLLAEKLRRFKNNNVVVLALPRGGVVVGTEVAKELHAPLDVVLVRKIGHPHNPEYAIGAIADGHEPILNPLEIRSISRRWLDREIRAARTLLAHRKTLYRSPDYHPQSIKDKTVVVVDDGMATGYTMAAAINAVLKGEPKKVVAAAPVASMDTIDALEPIADEVIVLDEPKNFLGSIGAHYRNFQQVKDEDVKELLGEVGYVHGTVTKNKHPAVFIQRDQEVPDHWTRYRPIR